MTLPKPDHVANNPIMSQKWDEITKDRDFDSIHATTIEQLCFWYAVLRTCQDDITVNGEIHVAYQNDIGDVKPMPQMSSAKQASDQIRQLNKQLGINDEAKGEQPKRGVTVIHAFQQNRQSKAQAAHRAKAG